MKANDKEAKSFLYTFIVSAFFFILTSVVLLFAVGTRAFHSPLWWLLIIVIATIPWGWRFLNSLFPVFFFSTSIIGMLVYVIFKALLSLFAGIVVMPWQIFSLIRFYTRAGAARRKFFKNP